MNDETAIIQQLPGALAEVSALADEFSRATRLTRYQEGLRDETIRRQKTDLVTFARFLESIHVVPGDFYHDLGAWAGIGAGLLEAFIEWQKLQGYSIGTINVRLATIKAYCHLAYEVSILDPDIHTHIQGVKGIQRKQARNIDARREVSRLGYKKAQAVDIPVELLYKLKHPATGFLAKRDALLMCLLLDHGLRVGEIAILKRNHIALRWRLLTFYRPKVDEPQTDRMTDDTLAAARAYLATLPVKQESLFDLAIISIQERVRTLGEARSMDINNRRAEMQKLPATLTVVEWLTILDYFDWKCAYCKDSPYEELEHIIPLNHGEAGTTKENCRPSCRACNAVKGRHHPDLLKQVSEGIERVRSEQSLFIHE